MEYTVELSVLDNGAVLSLTQSRHNKYGEAAIHARAIAKAWAKRYGFEAPTRHGQFFTVSRQARYDRGTNGGALVNGGKQKMKPMIENGTANKPTPVGPRPNERR